MMMSLPVVVIVHLISIPIWLIIDKKKALLPLVMVALAGVFVSRTYGFGHEPAELESGSSFSVLNYNVHSFQRDEPWWKNDGRERIADMKSWFKKSDPDIMCLSEYYSAHEEPFDFNGNFREQGFKYQKFYSRPKKEKHGNSWGVAVLSKYPIIASQDTIFAAQNGLIRADVNIKGDTVRVIAVHLYSMTLKLGNLVSQKQMDGVKRESKITFERMRNGFVRRSREMNVLASWINASPYPVIVCGDFNEIPYGYVYSKMRELLTNGFEEKGEGFGFTFNHLPYFIRIDHQFFSEEKLEIQDFKTFNEVKYSDHYPLMGTYQFRKKRKGED
ncbi:endonuclease/exonuclease/phosphatase family protein [Dyadobacter sp. CY326]|uniref:endonuclease/exonuclease/phosphatase family protein n=1 Tax=Dyadobacter sp. CY326 TaxID=2907300 RepID=UPI001F3535A8|nr:endonuclease/exonuclease/phosphatase family protein [Dyadobacter sp. CY326]MCE7064101.1 endonuclease/exonuclease/phosphatase family protein [Dyadobacter sp. CY326]